MSEPSEPSEPRNVWDLHCELGEGPVWVDGALWFVDIKKQKIYRYEPSSGGTAFTDTLARGTWRHRRG